MKKYVATIRFVLPILCLIIVGSCKEKQNTSKEKGVMVDTKNPTEAMGPKKRLSEDFKKYWYAGLAEITSYKLEQARYGELREGHAVLIYVTEPVLADKQVKADGDNASNIPVLKLNTTKKFLTGIYPYSIMTSSFYPVYDNQHAIKVSFSAQEWCGQVFMQLNNHKDFDITSHSYFESEADQEAQLTKTYLEDELWNKIRIEPADLPVGNLKIIPSFEFIRLSHKELKAYDAQIRLTKNGTLNSYEMRYPELDRTLTINFSPSFPYDIDSWTETSKSGFGTDALTLTSTATKIKTLRTAYWKENRNKDLPLRDSLGI
jgi:hypothetical protein